MQAKIVMKYKKPLLAIEWLREEITKDVDGESLVKKFQKEFEKAKSIEETQKNNLPIHIHQGINNTHVFIKDGIVNVKPNKSK